MVRARKQEAIGVRRMCRHRKHRLQWEEEHKGSQDIYRVYTY